MVQDRRFTITLDMTLDRMPEQVKMTADDVVEYVKNHMDLRMLIGTITNISVAEKNEVPRA